MIIFRGVYPQRNKNYSATELQKDLNKFLKQKVQEQYLEKSNPLDIEV